MRPPLGEAEFVELHVRRQLAEVELKAVPASAPDSAHDAARANLAAAEQAIAAEPGDRKPDEHMLARRMVDVVAEFIGSLDTQLEAVELAREHLSSSRAALDEQLVAARLRLAELDQAKQAEPQEVSTQTSDEGTPDDNSG